MAYDIENAMNNMFSSGKRSNYTVEQIDAAKKRQKKCGGTLMENLEAIASGATEGEEKPKSKSFLSMEELSNTISKLSENIKGDFGETSEETMKAMLDESLKQAKDNEQLDALLKEGLDMGNSGYTVKAGAGLGTSTMAIGNGSNLNLMEEMYAGNSTLDNAAILDKFAGVGDAVKETVFGQDDFVKKLVIAFKRPFVTERDSNDAMNSIFITGPACSGKHLTLNTLVGELGRRGVISGTEVYTMDLSLYPTTTEEKLFLQDLYSALQSKCSVIAFENFEVCHVSMLTRISDLVTTGECQLAERYIMQKGQLVSVNNALSDKTVGSFEASGKYFVFVSTKALDKLAGVMGAPFVNALGDVCATNALDEEAIRKIATKQEEQLVEKCKKQLSYEVIIEDAFKEYAIAQTSKNRALKGVLDTYADTIKALAQMKLERDDPSGAELILTCEDGAPVMKIGEEVVQMAALLPNSYKGELDLIKEEMNNIVGLKAVKEYILSLEEYYEIQKRRREEGLKAGEVNKHMIFTGNPGTGKTTIARIVSKYLKAIGVLSGGQLVEVSRGDLVGRYAGHTAPLTNTVIKSAIGGVLFIDEAYSLYRGEDDSFGLEAIDTLVKGIEDNRDDLIVILAGYSNEMEGFLESNSGLKSRFPNIIEFPDYTGDELCEIAKLTSKSKGYTIDEEVFAPMKTFFDVVQATNPMEAGNGRLVRNKIEEAILNQSRRLVAEPDADMSLLTLKDFVLENSLI